MPDKSLAALRADYLDTWTRALIVPASAAAAVKRARQILAARRRFETVSKATGVPWFVLGLLLMRESDLSFAGHLHNGDSLKNRTKHVPAGRPKQPDPPYTWEVSAIDAVRYDQLDRIRVWDVPTIAWACERFNGFGYREHGIRSPYLWSWSTEQERGKYTNDGDLHPEVWDEQPGIMTILMALIQIGAVDLARPGAVVVADQAPVTTADAVAAQAAPGRDAKAVGTTILPGSAGIAAAGLSVWHVLAGIVVLAAAVLLIRAWLRRRRAPQVAAAITAQAIARIEPRTVDPHTGAPIEPIG